MKNYFKPEIKIHKLQTEQLLVLSGIGCSCGCYTRDYPQTNAGCNGCNKCNHDNTINHPCDDEGYWKN